MGALRLAVIGCGAVSERYHLPVASAAADIELTALVDPDTERAADLARAFGVPRVLEEPGPLVGTVDAAIVAAPHHLHAGIAGDLLERGVHVLVEKPMALDVAGCDAMLAAAARGGAVLAVGLVRRHYEASRFLEHALQGGVIGTVTRFDAREGAPFAWRVTSDAAFRREAGGGVLFDIGSHLLDLLGWWLGDLEPVSYRDDAMGGVEADCEIQLRTTEGAAGVVELSRTRHLRNTIIIAGDEGTLEIGVGVDPQVHLGIGPPGRRLTGRVDAAASGGATRLADVFALQLADFAAAIAGDREPLVPGAQGRRAIALLEACRAAREPLELPWSASPLEAPPRDGTSRETT